MGLGEQGEATVQPRSRHRSPSRTDSLDLLAAHARQVRDDRRWRRQVRRQRTAIGGVILLVLLAALVYAVRSTTRTGPVGSGPTPVTRLEAASATPSPSPSPAAGPATPSPSAAPQSMARALYGKPRSGLEWHSGFWTGGSVDRRHIEAAGAWRGAPMDFATVYPAYGTWAEIQNSIWAISGFAGYRGRLAYGLPLLPKNRKGKWQDVISGRRDSVFTGIARDLVRYGHGDAAIRMGVEANGYWFPWSVTSDTVDEFHAAYERIRSLMLDVSPDFTFWLDLNCGTALDGAPDRMAPLWLMYPGDDLVDGISMDHYNRFKLLAADEASWQKAIAPSWAPGLQDGVDFARLHGKGFAVPEWGLDGVQGPGDSPFFMQQMFDFFSQNADVLVYENYFNEVDPYIAAGLYESRKNPKSAALYRTLWGKAG